MNDLIPSHILDTLCGSRYFNIPPKFISKFQDNNGTELKAKLRDFLSKTQHSTHANNIKICTARATIICGRLGSITSHDPCTTVLILDNGKSFVLTPFKSDFFDYVNCNTPVEYIYKSQYHHWDCNNNS